MSDDARPMAPLLEIDQASKRLRISTGVMPITRNNVAQFKHT
jgi:hypothetical protein